MKLEELQPGIEYAVYAGRYRRIKVRFSADDLKAPRSYRRKQGTIPGQTWGTHYGSEEGRWWNGDISLNQIKMTWAEYEIEAAQERKNLEERAEIRRIESEKAIQARAELGAYLEANKETVCEILGIRYAIPTGPVLRVDLTLEQLIRLVERGN